MRVEKIQAKNFKYVLWFISVTLIWGGSFLFVNDLLHDNIPIFLLMFARFTIGSIFLLVLRTFNKAPPIKKPEVFHGSIMGLIIFVAFFLQTLGAYYTTPAKNGMLTGLYVVFVAILEIVIKRKIRLKPIADALVCVIGMMILFDIFKSSFKMNLGDLLTILCALVFAAQFIVLEKYSPNLNSINYAIIQLIFVSAVSLILSLIFESSGYAAITLTPAIVLKVIFLGLFSTGYAYLIQTIVQTKLFAVTVSMVSCLESVFAVVFSIIFAYDNLTLSLVVGSLIILASMLSAVRGTGDAGETRF